MIRLPFLAGLAALAFLAACASKSQDTLPETVNNPHDMPTPAGTGAAGADPYASGNITDPSLNQPPKVDVTNMATTDYTVQSGDSLWKIARDHNTSVATIKALNNLSADIVRVGQVIKVPAK